jgi:hypothetical protein
MLSEGVSLVNIYLNMCESAVGGTIFSSYDKNDEIEE